MKKCSTCKQEKPLSEFSKKTSSKDGLCYQCKDCVKIMCANHYQKNKAAYIARARLQAVKDVDLYRAWKDSLSCVLCGEDDRNCIDLHHLDPSQKEFVVGRLSRHGFNSKKFQEEISKCIPVCANCHRKIHAYGIEQDNGKYVISSNLAFTERF